MAKTKQTPNGGKKMITVANPIYDCVFKYLMEDERIAKTLLTALLKKEVVSVEMRRHEHTNTTRNNISMFRIDFAAKVKEDDGKEKLMLIELQKTWVETETLRFRQYLASQYNAQENMMEAADGERQYAIPMVAVYLLGHRVGKVKNPVVYVDHITHDYDGKLVAEGMDDPFIRSLIHDSVIVQLPLLKGKIRNHLEKVLSVFDPCHRIPGSTQLVNLNEQTYEGDEEMMRIINRLTAATVTAEVRQEMNVEDEFFSAIENRDTILMKQKRMLAEKDELIAEREDQIAEKDELIAKREGQIAEKDSQIAEKDDQIAEKDSRIAEKDDQIAEKDSRIAERDCQLRSMINLMLNNDMSISQIVQATGLTQEQIENLIG